MVIDRWWISIVACPACGGDVPVRADASGGNCERCRLGWTQGDNVLTWEGADSAGEQRMLPVEWLESRSAEGWRRGLLWFRKLLWNLVKGVGFPLRYLVKVKLAEFHRRSVEEKDLAEEWRAHYLSGLSLPPDALFLEYSYRKVEKIGFAGLLGYRIAILDIRRHAWWGRYPHASFQIISLESRRLPFRSMAADLVFTDGLIFDIEAPLLDSFFSECFRVLKPGGYMLIWGGNSLAKSRARSEIRWHGRIHSLEEVRRSVAKAGFVEIDVTFEGYAPFCFPMVVNAIRKVLSPGGYKTYDFHSWLARWQTPERRAYWLLRLSKPTT